MSKLKRQKFEKELSRLQGRLCVLQDWVKSKGLRVIVIFEGRDAAGKGGTIKAITERVSPRVFRVVALPAPSDREKSQMYLQRYKQHFPAAGEIVIFDRSWDNRAGVEHVMGFLYRRTVRALSQAVPTIRKTSGRRRRSADQGLAGSRQQGAGTPIQSPHRRSIAAVEAESDGPAITRQVVRVSRARDAMLKATDTRIAPWYIVRSDDKRRARLNTIAHLLKMIPHKKLDKPKVRLPARSNKYAYNDEASLARRRFVREVY